MSKQQIYVLEVSFLLTIGIIAGFTINYFCYTFVRFALVIIYKYGAHPLQLHGENYSQCKNWMKIFFLK